jgi:subtilisin family serine protease
VAYRNGVIPANAESNTSLAGARIVAKHESLGIVTVKANGTASDAANLQHLAAQENVDFVVHDRMVYAHKIVASNSKVETHTPTAAKGSISMSNLAEAQADSFYADAQGWAVKQVGGYGKGIAGGTTQGPWNITTGTGARIAILDSGVDQKHPDIAPNLVFNLSEIDQTPMTGLPSACDDGTAQDQQGHGTWVASLAAGAAGADTGKVIGVAPSASILNIKVLERMPNTTVTGTVAQQCAAGQASGLLSWVIAGINDAVKQHADVISMSLGSMIDLSTGDGAGLKAIFDRATYAAAQAGSVLVAAAGNDGFDYSNKRYIELPAMARSVVAIVASTNPACAENLAAGATCVAGPVSVPYYSNFGSPMDALSAPGGNLPAGGDTAVSGWVRGACSSTGCFNLGNAQYVQAMGTSASAPLAAGVAALIHSAHPTWDAATVVAAMRSSATATATMPYGQVNAAVALGVAQ